MKESRQKAIIAACCLLLGQLVVGTPALAAAPPGSATYFAAAKQFEQLSAGAVSKGAMPMSSDPGVAPVLGTLSNAAAVFGTQSYTVDDIGGLMDVCNKANALQMSYALFGAESLKSDVDHGMPTSELAGKLVALMNTNVHRYQDEMSPLVAFSTRCMAKVTPLLVIFTKHLKPGEMTDIRRQGLEQTRQGLINMNIGTMTAAVDENLSTKNRRVQLDAEADTIGDTVGILRLEQRAQLLQAALEIRSKLTVEFIPPLDRLIEAYKRTDCTDVCTY